MMQHNSPPNPCFCLCLTFSHLSKHVFILFDVWVSGLLESTGKNFIALLLLLHELFDCKGSHAQVSSLIGDSFSTFVKRRCFLDVLHRFNIYSVLACGR